MTLFDPQQQALVERLFKSMGNSDIQFVVPRGFQGLPERVPGGDIDVLVRAEDFKTATSVATQHGFDRPHEDLPRVLRIGYQAVRNPKSAFRLVKNDPMAVYRLFANKDADDDMPVWRGYIETDLIESDVHVHLHNHLAYTSPMNGVKTRVDSEVETAMFARRRPESVYYVPSTPDELAHLVCRGVFDHEGAFPEYYITRCNQLTEQCTSEEWEQFESLCSRIFYAADEVVINSVQAGEYAAIRERLVSYSNY